VITVFEKNFAFTGPGNFCLTLGLPKGPNGLAQVWNCNTYLSNPFSYILTELIGIFEMLDQLRQETQDIQWKPWIREETTGMADYGTFQLVTMERHAIDFISD
jgi:hypothetical protein